VPLKKRQDFSSLSIDQAGLGVQLCIDNANRLIEAAKLLSERGFLELATFAVCTAIEETGKALLLLNYQEDKAAGGNEAAKTLEKSFREHPDKLELAIGTSEVDKQLVSRLLQTDWQDRRPEAMASKLLEIMDSLKISDLKPQIKTTFETRNQMLYIEFRDGQFLAPKYKAQRSQFEQLMDIAEKISARAELDLAYESVLLKRGLTGAQFAEFIKRELQTIIDIWQKKHPRLKN
jgi:AbiV family abortive infection protein